MTTTDPKAATTTHEPTRRRGGRPWRVGPEKLAAILEQIRRGYSFDRAAEAVDVSAEAWRRYRRAHPEAQAAAEAARIEHSRRRLEGMPKPRLFGDP